MEDNPACMLAVADRLALLHHRHLTWLNFFYDFCVADEVPCRTSGQYELKPEAYLLGKDSFRDGQTVTDAVQWAALPCSSNGKVVWSELAIGKKIIDFSPAIAEHNLIVLLTRVEGTNDSPHGVVEIQLIDFRTGAPHSKAAQPTLSISIMGSDYADENRFVDVTIEISGKNLAVAGRIPIWSTGFVFLAENILMHPSITGRVEVYHISPSIYPRSGHVHLIKTFLLPMLAHSSSFVHLECRGEPSPHGPNYSVLEARPFYTSLDASIIQISLTMHSDSGTHHFTFLVPRAVLLPMSAELARTGQTLKDSRTVVLWSEWGSVTRWFNMGEGNGMDNELISMVYARLRMATGTVGMNPYETERVVVRVISGVANIAQRVFAEDVGGTLPYIEIRSIGGYRYDTVMISEEQILLARTDPDDFGVVKSFEALHF
ncbi:hypothetical protein B0H10DRAFT_1937698 [Mycena sp. CBHHK59/15]|nr:hypothetical protein B0H10DRAFT_1937698 [Mycena sp. CBHHK59/15]